MSAFTGLHAFTGQMDLVGSFSRPAEAESDNFLGCWIVDKFSAQQTVADFMWMWISAFSSLLAYVAVFLILRGFITVEGRRVRWTHGQESPDIPQSNILAYKMLA